MENHAETLYCQACGLLEHNPPDTGAAVPLLREAAEAGHTEAAFRLAACLSETEQPDIRAVCGWLQRAADSGHGYAAYNLLQIREAEGESFVSQIDGYTRLAENGILPAQLRLFEYYATAQDPRAVHWAAEAAKQEHPLAQYYLAQHEQNAAEPDYSVILALYLKAAEQGLPLAHWQLGRLYLYGQGVEPDSAAAAEHLAVAAEAGIVPAQTELAGLLQERNDPAALKWYRAAANQDDDNARAALAHLYLTGTLTERNPNKARRYARAAAENRHPEGLRLMGDIYRYGLGVNADEEAARAYYREAAELGNIAAYQKLISGAILNQEQQEYDQTKTAALLRQQTERAFQAAEAAAKGIGRAQDFALARKLYLEAAEFQHRQAMSALGKMYYRGQGVETDYAQAAYWFELAAEQGDPAAQYSLACLHYFGQGLPQSTPQACRLLEAALDNGYPDPQAARRLLKEWQDEQQNPSRLKPPARPAGAQGA